MVERAGGGRKNRRLCSLKTCTCRQCGAEFNAVMARARFCSKQCSGKFYFYSRSYSYRCRSCGSEFHSKQAVASYCSAACQQPIVSKKLQKHYAENCHPSKKWSSRADAYRFYDFKRRAVTGASDAEIFSAEEIFERDGWLCQICDEEIDRELVFPNPGTASLDHKIPISLGGRHTRANVQCSHLGCNSRKSNKLLCEIAA